MASPRFDLPVIEDADRPWWDAAREHRLLIRRCDDCGAAHFYPRPFCPQCWSESVRWEEASGRATLYTHSTVHRNDLPPFGERVPYVAAVVDLAEGPRMMTEVVGTDPADDGDHDRDRDHLAIGMALEVTWREVTDEVTVPVFRPAR